MSDDSISLTLEPRTITGKAVRQLRRDGQIPAVIHDHGQPSVVVQANSVQLLKVWQQAGRHHPVQIKTGSKNYTALIKSVDFDPKKHQLRHVVFNAVNADEKVEAEVPIHPRYDEGNESSPAERSGLLVLSQLDTVLVESTPDKLPDVLYYNAEKLVEIGDHAIVADLILPASVIVKTDANHSVATVFEPSALAAANEALAGEAELEEETDVESDAEEGADEEGADEEGAQEGESQPDGKDQKEAKPASTEAAKEDAKESDKSH